MSFGLIDLKLSAFVGNPSITYKGSVLPLMVLASCTVDFAPGCPVELY
jgi:alkyl hydroperoxide reductase subunit AhpC